ncbi:MAG TPA: cytochrome d ubiquinol oxidase subunit II, partial [Armatimonadota bacterium]|nr:cytochrome d ubiquinol oxidase subunit II [Armatimonadota bacterium]
ILALLALIVRAVSIEFGIRSTDIDRRHYWGVAVGVSSSIAIFLLGAVLGNILRGLPLNQHGEYAGTQWNLLNAFALLTGGLNLVMLATYGATYVSWHADDLVKKRSRQWVHGGWALYVLFLLLVVGFALASSPHLLRNYRLIPALWILPSLGIAAVLAIGLWNVLQRGKTAFFTSAFAIVILLLTVVTSLFPTLVPARGAILRSLTIANAASSPTSLVTMLVITAITMPLVILSIIWSYRLFGGKINTEQHY